MEFKDKVVLITGASSGIGAETALEFAKQGAKLSLVGRNAENLSAVGEKCRLLNGSESNLIIADVTKDCKKIVESTITKYGKIDVLVNNAGILKVGSIEEAPVEQYDDLFSVNVRPFYELTHLAVPHLIKTRGSVVNVSSLAGLRAFPGWVAYCMSKGALEQFTKCVALDLAQKGVRVNSVNPGVIVTDIFNRAGFKEEDYKAFLKHGEETHPLGRVGTVDEVARVILFLASDRASFITGASIPIDGGRHASCPR